MSLGFRLVKMADIAYITVMYFLAGFLTAKFFDKFIVPENKPDHKETTAQKILNAILYVSLTSIAIYLLRNIVEYIPSPFEGIYGLKHGRVHELVEAPILIFAIFYYQHHLDEHLKDIYSLF